MEKKSNRDKNLALLLKSLAILASRISTKFITENLNELRNRLKVPLLQKQAGKSSNRFNEVLFAILDKLLEYKCLSTKQHKFLLLKCLN